MNNRAALLTAIAWMVLSSGAPAQTQTQRMTIYRCGADGRDLRDSPCPVALKASAVQIEFDQPSEAQRRAMRNQAMAEARQARAMERQRHQDEAQARRNASRAVGIDGLAVPAAAQPASAPKPVKPPTPPKAPKLVKPSKPSMAASSAG